MTGMSTDDVDGAPDGADQTDASDGVACDSPVVQSPTEQLPDHQKDGSGNAGGGEASGVKHSSGVESVPESALRFDDPVDGDHHMEAFLKHGVVPNFKYREKKSTHVADPSLKEVSDELLPEAKHILDKVMQEFGSGESFSKATFGPLLPHKEVDDFLRGYMRSNRIKGTLNVKWVRGLNAAGKIRYSYNPKRPEERIFTLYVAHVPEDSAHKSSIMRQYGLRAFANHEIGTHLVRSLNDGLQPWAHKRVQYGLRKVRETSRADVQAEEGLATVNTVMQLRHQYLWSAALLYYSCAMARTLNFADLFNHLRQYLPDDWLRWKQCIRVKRLVEDNTLPGGYGRDQAYFEGAVAIIRNLNHLDFRMLYCGKLNLEEAAQERVRRIARSGLATIPAFCRLRDDTEDTGGPWGLYKAAIREMGVLNGLISPLPRVRQQPTLAAIRSPPRRSLYTPPTTPVRSVEPPASPGGGSCAVIDSSTMNAAVNRLSRPRTVPSRPQSTARSSSSKHGRRRRRAKQSRKVAARAAKKLAEIAAAAGGLASTAVPSPLRASAPGAAKSAPGTPNHFRAASQPLPVSVVAAALAEVKAASLAAEEGGGGGELRVRSSSEEASPRPATAAPGLTTTPPRRSPRPVSVLARRHHVPPMSPLQQPVAAFLPDPQASRSQQAAAAAAGHRLVHPAVPVLPFSPAHAQQQQQQQPATTSLPSPVPDHRSSGVVGGSTLPQQQGSVPQATVGSLPGAVSPRRRAWASTPIRVTHRPSKSRRRSRSRMSRTPTLEAGPSPPERRVLHTSVVSFGAGGSLRPNPAGLRFSRMSMFPWPASKGSNSVGSSPSSRPRPHTGWQGGDGGRRSEGFGGATVRRSGRWGQY